MTVSSHFGGQRNSKKCHTNFWCVIRQPRHERAESCLCKCYSTSVQYYSISERRSTHCVVIWHGVMSWSHECVPHSMNLQRMFWLKNVVHVDVSSQIGPPCLPDIGQYHTNSMEACYVFLLLFFLHWVEFILSLKTKWHDDISISKWTEIIECVQYYLVIYLWR